MKIVMTLFLIFWKKALSLEFEIKVVEIIARIWNDNWRWKVGIITYFWDEIE